MQLCSTVSVLFLKDTISYPKLSIKESCLETLTHGSHTLKCNICMSTAVTASVTLCRYISPISFLSLMYVLTASVHTLFKFTQSD